MRHTSWYLVCIASSDSKADSNKATDRERQKQKSKYKYLLKALGLTLKQVIKTSYFNRNWQDAVTRKDLGEGLYEHRKK